jgi:hypothetical protein
LDTVSTPAVLTVSNNESTNTQRNFSEMVFLECCLCLSRLFERKNAMDVNFEWAGLNQLIQSVDCLTATFAIVRVAAYSIAHLRRRHYAVWIRNAATSSNCRKRSISRFTTGGDERGVDPIGRKFKRDIQHVVTTTIDCCIRAETFDKANSVFA